MVDPDLPMYAWGWDCPDYSNPHHKILGKAFPDNPVVPMLDLLVVIVFLLGAAEGTVDVGGNILLAWIRSPKIGSLMNALHLFFGLGVLISPLVLAQSTGRTGGIYLGYWIIAALIEPVAVLLFLTAGR